MTDAAIILTQYNPKWPIEFQKEKEFLLVIIGEYLCGTVEHIGSTSMPGLIAKPVIDIMFGVESLSKSRPAIEIISQNGYCYYPYKEEVMHWFCKPSPEFRTHHLHLVPYKSDLWQERVKFRDALIADEKLTLEYSKLKQNLALKHKHDREQYTEAKTDFIRRVLGASKSF